ncbi:hypothetical protein Lal_00036308 [Lupinus albus]|uniref:Putative transcription factor interactor and regulator C3H-WRC/GRF family n=1 Tax=Lupinus albus TaxID=3870 RepID=A0A6A5P420_LUPAL|nr:putative transcription factor interactor and regulator C3H-WRC/GRF family [Lupinus albus]KAF1891958.1 hypothetical protein Lal_00036308 [Lupinus albus]
MRIRKSQVIFHSYFSYTVHLSDPNLMNRSPVMVQLNDAATTTITTQHTSSAAKVSSNLDYYQPFDQTLPPIVKTSNGYDPSGIGESGPHIHHNKQQPLDEDIRREESGDSVEKGNCRFRKGIIFGSEIVALPPSSLSSTQDGRLCEGEKVILLKKQRGSFEDNGKNIDSSKKMKAKMKTKMNKKCSIQNDNDEDDDDDIDWVEEDTIREIKKLYRVSNNNVGKKKAKGSAVMEGSRCSRVNGRGWRCCQQTLVGYSLCEHHLGKGRLRSMSSVRNRSIASTTESDHKNVHDDIMSEPISEASSIPEKKTKCVSVSDNYPLVSDDEKKSMIVTKRKMKLGMVKARSISSLLGQTKNNVVVHEDNK